ncbi:MAG: ribonuclease J [Deltaproteobacteria bacterium RIFCSPLOWO2_12_FULL_43_16]|nr:MAG: ribonuclease J [Deltaproteobacteria bacterium GWA2_43_19]OGQ11027.1 MAG: ribonuclease J [Deltaproteobacteria bacterium RIFCSPHIGHO2_02_FULL_43_33]OGQ61860.1 MAG: ribonuclease J [Deltaproteobacteria bacterium RIFCSPLOWO2_12_FULL_43_16]HBR16025.1 ribonuclease J [Deltaproteobacteria bacterium]
MNISTQNPLRIIPLGGLGEIGLNMMLVEYDDSIIIVDCGLMFPEDYMLGIDIVIPDITYLKKNREKVKAFLITHGHEDHTGALPFVLRDIKTPIYGTALTLGLIKEKLKEFNLDKETEFITVKPRGNVSIGPFDIEFIRVSHSIADGVALAIKTPVGVVIHTGDFKLDQTPVDGEILDYARFSEYGEKGVLLLLSDSTNVEKEGYTMSEKEIGKTFEEIFSASSGRIIVAAFSSNIHRIQQVINVAEKFGRKVMLNGRSMVANVGIARELGYLKMPDGLIIDLRELDNLPPQRAVLLTTGSQGEPMSALTRMAMDDHKQIKIRKGDTVILSSKFIPGHEKAISNMMNHLYRRGAEVIYEKVSEIHVSGHASQEELKIMLNMVKPKYFIPIHGEYRHLVKHSQLAERVGVKKENIILAEDGDVVEITESGAAIREKTESGKVFVDGKGVGDVGDVVLKDRKHLSQDGMVIAILALNEKTGEVIYGPDIITRGLIFEEESAELIGGAKNVVMAVLGTINIEAKTDWLEVKEEIRKALRRFFNKTLERRPVILPMIIEI